MLRQSGAVCQNRATAEADREGGGDSNIRLGQFFESQLMCPCLLAGHTKGQKPMKDISRALRAVGLVALVSGVLVAVCFAWTFPGRMTGGGSVFVGDAANGAAGVNGGRIRVDSATVDNLNRVTHGFELHCGQEGVPPPNPNSLEINWKDAAGNSHKFHLTNLAFASCTSDGLSPIPPPAPFDKMEGGGAGKLDNVPGASIYFVLTDHGEPGTADTASYVILDANGFLALYVPQTFLTFGNQQAHAS